MLFCCTFQSARHSPAQARAALKYIVLALSGHMDDILGKYKVFSLVLVFLCDNFLDLGASNLL